MSVDSSVESEQHPGSLKREGPRGEEHPRAELVTTRQGPVTEQE